MRQVLGPQVSPTDKSPDQVGSDLLAPQVRRWQVDTCRIKRSGVLQTTGVARKKEPQAISRQRDGCLCLLGAVPEFALKVPRPEQTRMVDHPNAWPHP